MWNSPVSTVGSELPPFPLRPGASRRDIPVSTVGLDLQRCALLLRWKAGACRPWQARSAGTTVHWTLAGFCLTLFAPPFGAFTASLAGSSSRLLPTSASIEIVKGFSNLDISSRRLICLAVLLILLLVGPVTTNAAPVQDPEIVKVNGKTNLNLDSVLIRYSKMAEMIFFWKDGKYDWVWFGE